MKRFVGWGNKAKAVTKPEPVPWNGEDVHHKDWLGAAIQATQTIEIGVLGDEDIQTLNGIVQGLLLRELARQEKT